MIIAILIILSFAVNFILLVYIKQQQEINQKIHYKIQDDIWDEITQIRKTVRGIDRIDRKIDFNEHLKKD
tara:strand:- start:591 stop:800 length:210 start_codon:yes stop_codon:yes gene_type:complete